MMQQHQLKKLLSEYGPNLQSGQEGRVDALDDQFILACQAAMEAIRARSQVPTVAAVRLELALADDDSKAPLEVIEPVVIELWKAELDEIAWFDLEALDRHLEMAPSRDLPEYHYYKGFLAGIELSELVRQQ